MASSQPALPELLRQRYGGAAPGSVATTGGRIKELFPRIETAAALNGRHRLVEALRARGFGLR